MPRSIARWRTCCGSRRAIRNRGRSRRTATTSGSTVRLASICLSVCSPERLTGDFRSTTRPPTTWIWSSPAALADSLPTCLGVVRVLEGNGVFLNQNPNCEPQLGRRGLYDSMGGHAHQQRSRELALAWVLNLSDGTHSLLDIAERSGLSFEAILAAASVLLKHGLMHEQPYPGRPGGDE